LRIDHGKSGAANRGLRSIANHTLNGSRHVGA